MLKEPEALQIDLKMLDGAALLAQFQGDKAAGETLERISREMLLHGGEDRRALYGRIWQTDPTARHVRASLKGHGR